MAGEKIQLDVVTPKGKALGIEVDEVRAPSVQGEFGVLPGHLPLLAALRTGLVTYRRGSEEHKCAIGAGFAEVGPEKLLILTDEYVEREGVDPVVVRKELADIQAEIQKLAADTNPDNEGIERRRVLIAKENWFAAQLELYGDPPAATMRPDEEWGPPEPPRDEDVPTETAATGSAADSR